MPWFALANFNVICPFLVPELFLPLFYMGAAKLYLGAYCITGASGPERFLFMFWLAFWLVPNPVSIGSSCLIVPLTPTKSRKVYINWGGSSSQTKPAATASNLASKSSGFIGFSSYFNSIFSSFTISYLTSDFGSCSIILGLFPLALVSLMNSLFSST